MCPALRLLARSARLQFGWLPKSVPGCIPQGGAPLERRRRRRKDGRLDCIFSVRYSFREVPISRAASLGERSRAQDLSALDQDDGLTRGPAGRRTQATGNLVESNLSALLSFACSAINAADHASLRFLRQLDSQIELLAMHRRHQRDNVVSFSGGIPDSALRNFLDYLREGGGSLLREGQVPPNPTGASRPRNQRLSCPQCSGVPLIGWLALYFLRNTQIAANANDEEAQTVIGEPKSGHQWSWHRSDRRTR